MENEEEQRRIIRLIHDEAHLSKRMCDTSSCNSQTLSYILCIKLYNVTGVNRVLSVITPKYYWPGMYKDVEVYIMGCEKCQRSKPKLEC